MRYHWKIETAPAENAGTDADVWLSLAGDRGKTPEIELDDPDVINDWEAGKINQGFIDTDDVGNLLIGTLRINDKGAFPSWKPRYVQITNDVDNRVWFASVDREVKPEIPFVLKFKLENAGTNAPPPAPPPPPPPAALGDPTAADIRLYQAGYEEGRSNPQIAPDGRYGRWYQLGMQDGQMGIASRFPLPGSPSPTPAPPGGVQYLELYFVNKLTGRGVPYDDVVKWTRLGPVFAVFFDWELLGLIPGDSREGFRLSGPTGPIAKYVADLVARGDMPADPRVLGLTAFVAARGKRNIRFISRRELADLGVLAAYPQLATRT